MIVRLHKPGFTTLLLLILAIMACRLPQTGSSSPTSLPTTQAPGDPIRTVVATQPVFTPTSPKNHPTASPSLPAHRITTHRIYGIAEFFDQDTSQQFIPRGVNYAIRIPILDHYEDRLFGVGVYDHQRTQADFAAISASGYNVIRIMLDGCTSGEGCIGVPDGQGLNAAYMDNVADLMRLAKEANLFLIVATNDLPELGGYANLANQGADRNFGQGRNAQYLTIEGIRAAQQYWTDLLVSLISRQAPTEIVLGWELQSEQYYHYDQAPFNLDKGKVSPADGRTYDLSVPKQKETLAENGLRYYIDQVRRTILSYDPTALITMGFIAPDSPNTWREGDDRWVALAGLLEQSPLEFFDLHAYPGMGLSMAEISQNFGLSGHVSKPFLMGEVGANTWVYPQIAEGVIAIQDWIADSCAYGFSGWLYKGYYPDPAGLTDANWGLIDQQNSMLNALSPKNQPDACLTTVLPGRNLALKKQVSVSASLADQTPQMAVDGDLNTQWSAGAFPTQWIEIDLGATYTVGEVRLTVGQWPDGEVVHELWVGATRDNMKKVHEFSGHDYDFDVLSFVPDKALDNIRFVRIITTESPSWVSWREIELLAPFPTTPTPTVEVTPTP